MARVNDQNIEPSQIFFELFFHQPTTSDTQQYTRIDKMESWLWDSAHIVEWEQRLATFHELRDGLVGSCDPSSKKEPLQSDGLTKYLLLTFLLTERREPALRLAHFDEPPDKQRELFVGKPFTLFPELPIELRRKIWRETFEAHHVDLSIRGCVAPHWRPIMMDREDDSLYLPITLFVNRESREKTVRYYCYLFDNHANPSPSLYPSCPVKLLPPECFNPSLDSGSISYGIRGISEYPVEYVNLISYIDSVAPGGVRTLQRLRVNWMVWSQESRHELESEDSSGSGIHELSEILLRFSGLKELQLEFYDLTCYSWSDYGLGFVKNLENLKDCRESIQRFLDNHKHRFRDSQAPAVTVFYFVRTPGKTSERYHYSTSAGEREVEYGVCRSGKEWHSWEGGKNLNSDNGEFE
jgi:hypothetical protein